jgi:hypothetical protein
MVGQITTHESKPKKRSQSVGGRAPSNPVAKRGLGKLLWNCVREVLRGVHRRRLIGERERQQLALEDNLHIRESTCNGTARKLQRGQLM